MRVAFLPMNRIVEAEAGVRLSGLMDRHGLPLEKACGGNGLCGKCRVLMTKGNDRKPSAEEQRLLSPEELQRGMRLACCVRLWEDACVILEEKPEPWRKREEKREEEKPIRRAGIVFDMGTTTLEAAVFDLDGKEKLYETGRLNPQIRYGSDIISRLAFCLGGCEQEKTMRLLLIGAFEDILRECSEKLFLPLDRIEMMAAAGNTVMSHFFAQRPVKGLERAPFYSGFAGGEVLKPKDLHITGLSAGCPVLLPAHMGGYAGSDALLSALASGFMEKKGNYFVIDIGTNAEMVLLEDGTCRVCSVPAGPAFEGALISQGMRGEEGAICRIKEKEGEAVCTVIGGGPAKGICGSGLIDCAAVLLRLHTMEESGYLRCGGFPERNMAGPAGVTICRNADGSGVRLLQEDIRKLQMAKAAVYAGMCALLESAGLAPSDLDGVCLSGNFGSHIDIKNAFAIGLLPEFCPDRLSYIGNGVIAGGAKLLGGVGLFSGINRTAREAEHLELADSKRFRDLYVQAMNFPKQEYGTV